MQWPHLRDLRELYAEDPEPWIRALAHGVLLRAVRDLESIAYQEAALEFLAGRLGREDLFYWAGKARVSPYKIMAWAQRKEQEHDHSTSGSRVGDDGTGSGCQAVGPDNGTRHEGCGAGDNRQVAAPVGYARRGTSYAETRRYRHLLAQGGRVGREE